MDFGPGPVSDGLPVKPSPPVDAINPAHYRGVIECIEVLEQIGVGEDFCRGNAIKYLWRMGRKGNMLEDAKKAQWYVNRLVARLETWGSFQESDKPTE